MQYLTKSDQDTQKLGEEFGKKSKGGEVFLLLGDLGGGKTQFAKGLAQGLGVQEEITSPTFTFEKMYEGDKKLYHFDLYRSPFLDPDIAEHIKEAFLDKAGVVVIEWAERAEEIWPTSYIKIEFIWKSENEREINTIKK